MADAESMNRIPLTVDEGVAVDLWLRNEPMIRAVVALTLGRELPRMSEARLIAAESVVMLQVKRTFLMGLNMGYDMGYRLGKGD